MEFTAELIASFLGGEIVGDKNAKVWAISKIEEGVEGSLSFLSNPKYEEFIYSTNASIVIVNRDFVPSKEIKATLVKVDNAYACFAKLLELYVSNKPRKSGISPLSSIDSSAQYGENSYIGEFTVVSPKARVGDNCLIYPNVYIGDRAVIGSNVTIFPGVVIYEDCVVGNNVIIHSGAVIGADGFGFAPTADGTFSKIPQIGNVVIEDDVEIGANTCIDRATMGSTIIKKGVKLDNLIQIAHNVVIGENTVCAAQLGVAGSTKIGRNCMTGGQVGIQGHITVGNNVQIASKSGIIHNVPDGEVRFGYPSMPGRRFHRVSLLLNDLPEINDKVRRMEKELEQLKLLIRNTEK